MNLIQQGRKEKQESVISQKFKWRSSDAFPDFSPGKEYPQFCTLTGEMEVGWPSDTAVDDKWVGELFSGDEDNETVVVVTRFHAKEQAVAGAVINPASDLGYFVWVFDAASGLHRVVPYTAVSHTPEQIAGMVITGAAAVNDEVTILRY